MEPGDIIVVKPRWDKVGPFSVVFCCYTANHMYCLCRDTKNMYSYHERDTLLNKTKIYRERNAACIIQRSWKKYRAIRVIRPFILHWAFKPGGCLAPTRFTNTSIEHATAFQSFPKSISL